MLDNQNDAYGKAVKALLHDEELRRKLEQDPAGMLKALGLNATPEVIRKLEEAQQRAADGQPCNPDWLVRPRHVSAVRPETAPPASDPAR